MDMDAPRDTSPNWEKPTLLVSPCCSIGKKASAHTCRGLLDGGTELAQVRGSLSISRRAAGRGTAKTVYPRLQAAVFCAGFGEARFASAVLFLLLHRVTRRFRLTLTFLENNI